MFVTVGLSLFEFQQQAGDEMEDDIEHLVMQLLGEGWTVGMHSRTPDVA